MRHDYRDILADIYDMVGRSEFAFRDVRAPLEAKYSANGSVMKELVAERMLRVTGMVARKPGRYVYRYTMTKDGIATATTAARLRGQPVAAVC